MFFHSHHRNVRRDGGDDNRNGGRRRRGAEDGQSRRTFASGGRHGGDDFRGRGFDDERRGGDDIRGRGFGDERRGGGDFRGRGGRDERHGGRFGHRRDAGGRHDGDHRGRRPLEHGDLRLVLLALVARKPSHGYELIKAIEQASSGLYVPSPGVIYPTLSLLVDQDFLSAESPEGQSRKSYHITAEGETELARHRPAVDAIFARLSQIGERRQGNLLPGITESLDMLRGLLRGNMMRADLTPEQVERINDALRTAVKSIEAELNAGPDEV